MKKLLFTITLSFIISCSFAQWEWQNPLPQGNSLNSLSVIEDEIWAVGENGTIIYSPDGGISWELQNSDISEHLNDVCFVDSEYGWAISDKSIIYTIDGGENWTLSEKTRLPDAYTSICFIDRLTGWIVGWSAALPDELLIINTTDGGSTWEYQNYIGEYSHSNHKVYFIDQYKGWITLRNNIIHTIDGGINWVAQNPNIGDYLTDIFFINSNFGWAIGSETVLRTINGGETWEASPDTVLTYKGLNTVSFISNSTGWCGGFYYSDEGDLYNGAIIKTTDGGITWENQLDYLYIRPVLSLTYELASGGIAIGEHGEILKSTNEENDWTKISSEFTYCDLADVFFIDNQNGWVAGSYSSPGIMPNPCIYNTNDGGLTWTFSNLPIEGPGYINKLFFTDNQHGWSLGMMIYGVDQVLISTVDGGENWEVQTSEIVANDIYFIDNTMGWIVGENGAIQKSEDGGWNWSHQQSGTDRNLNSVIFIDDEIGWVVGDSVILYTANGGGTWVEQSSGIFPWNDVYFIDQQHGWVAGYHANLIVPGSFGKIMQTTDGGNNWVELEGYNFSGLTQIYFANMINGWVLSSPLNWMGFPEDRILYTHDGGLTWDIQPTPTGSIQGGFSFINENEGWAVGSNGTILHTNNGGTSGVFKPQLQHSNFTTNFYPNPFTTSTAIEYELHQPEKVTLSIYNHLGQIVYQTQENQPQGSQQLIWNADGYSEGVYYYRLEVGDAIANGKMVKVR
jgi:photosystem II stability/assembly factor-like uncharacterized protein